MAQDVVKELKALDFSNQATLFGAGLLASLLPFVILLSAFASARIDNYIALRLGLNRRAAGVVTQLIASSHVSLNAATAISVLFIVTGTLAVASSLQQIYEKAFHLSHRGRRSLLRPPTWIVALCLTVALETVVVRPVRNLPLGLGMVAVVTFVIMTVFFWWTIHFLLAGRVPWLALLPPAIVTGLLFAGFGVFSRFYFSRTIISNTKLYGAIGAVFSIMTWLIATGAMVILGAVAGAVWQDRRTSRGGEKRRRPPYLSRPQREPRLHRLWQRQLPGRWHHRRDQPVRGLTSLMTGQTSPCAGEGTGLLAGGPDPQAEGQHMETVKSAGGTAIAYDGADDGPVLIVSVGAFCTRQTFVAPDDLFGPHR